MKTIDKQWESFEFIGYRDDRLDGTAKSSRDATQKRAWGSELESMEPRCVILRKSKVGIKNSREYMGRSPRGFSLIELLIVVAIILIIAAIAIPNLMQSRIAANQASAVSSLRSFNTAEITYSSTYNTGYTSALSYLAPPASGNPTSTAAGLVDSVLASGTKSGYNFTYTPSTNSTTNRTDIYSFNANPVSPGTSGTNHYFTDQSGVIRQNSTAVAGVSDSPIAG